METLNVIIGIVILVLIFVFLERFFNKKVEQKKLNEKKLKRVLIKEKETKQKFLYNRKFVLVRKNNQLWKRIVKEKDVILYNEKQKKTFVCSLDSFKEIDDNLEITFTFKYFIED